MAVTVTPVELAAHLRLGDGESPLAEPTASMMVHYLEVVSAVITDYAPNAPTPVQNEAAVRLSGWLYDSPYHGMRGNYFANGFTHSGASAILGPFRERRVGMVK